MGAMADDSKYKIDKFNKTNFVFWKIKVEDLLYQKKLYLSLNGIFKKNKVNVYGKIGSPRSSDTRFDSTLTILISCFQHCE